jgi:hypothetical protein
MRKKQKLKVFRTSTGFHDAYVAAPSQNAALAAWGSKHDLFARGAAELVDDPDLMKEPLAQPGVVFRRSRGSAEEQLAALGPVPIANRRKPPEKSSPAQHPGAPAPRRKIVAPKMPKPDRSALREAERSLEKLERRHAETQAELAHREAELERERKVLDSRQSREAEKLRRKADKLKASYERALSSR